MDERFSHLLTALAAGIGGIGLAVLTFYFKFRTGQAHLRTLSSKQRALDSKQAQDNFEFMSAHMQETIASLTVEARKSLEREIGHVARIATLEAEVTYLKATVDELRARK